MITPYCGPWCLRIIQSTSGDFDCGNASWLFGSTHYTGKPTKIKGTIFQRTRTYLHGEILELLL